MISISESQLEGMVQRIVDCAHPRRIYLYGSHAYGRPHADSDIDVLLVVDDSEIPSYKRTASVYASLRGMSVPVEIKLDTTDEFERRSSWLSSIERRVKEKGRVLYDAAA